MSIVRLALVLCLLSASAWGAAPSHPVIPVFERFHASGKLDDRRAGQLLLGELNCTSCHRTGNETKELIHPRTAPRLTQVGGRVRVEWLRKFIADPTAVKPGTTMPHLWSGVDPVRVQAEVESLVHFLMADSPGTPIDHLVPRAAVERGQKAFAELGCIACHGALRDGAPQLATSVPLGTPAEKYTYQTLSAFLKDPLAVRPSARMPSFNLKDDEARDLAAWFCRDVEGTANFLVQAYEGNWNRLPDFSTLQPKQSGKSVGLDVEATTRRDQVALRFEGYLQITKSGMYNFHLGSDDGSRLVIDGAEVVNNDGTHPHSVKSGRTRLLPGPHRLVVEWFNGGGDRTLGLEIDGDGMSRQPIDALVTIDERPATVDPSRRFAVDPQRVEQGRALFASLGCAACHERREDNQPVASTRRAPALKELPSTGGCLTPPGQSGRPFYAFTPGQTTALSAALAATREQLLIDAQPPKLTPQERIARTMATFNCYACHERDNLGGPEAERDEAFLTTTKEFGDEGRLPPKLDGVGGKLRLEYLKSVLGNGSDDRPYILAKMPRFGGAAAALGEDFEQLDLLPPLKLPPFPEPDYRVKGDGRQLVGARGFSCIKCHNFNQVKAEGIPGIDMTIMTKRLRQEWFHQYVRDPQSFRPGTRMPSAWPKTGKSLLGNILEGDNDWQVAAVWKYLEDGGKAAMPLGMGGQPIELRPITEAIIYRNFIEGAGPRAIGVGHPEKVHYAWDANQLRLALIWHGAFIDASKHWVGRGPGFQGPLGDHVVKLADGVSFARLETTETPWPQVNAKELGYQFSGYRLDDAQRPTFLYRLNDLQVEETILPQDQGKRDQGLRRSLVVRGGQPGDHWVFRAAQAATVKETDDGWYRLDDTCRLRIESDGSAIRLRPASSGTELLVPAVWREGRWTIQVEYQW